MREKYEAVIGLEIHAQLATNSKIFASDTNFFGSEPNTNISVITLAHPGTLPKVNAKAIAFAVRWGLASQAHINQRSVFDRKNYFYPDLPKGYQISQDKLPICVGGFIPVLLKDADGNLYEKSVKLHHTHLEEDAGKSIHDADDTCTLLDYNRAGTPLIEIVSEPDLHTAEEAGAYLSEVRKIVRYLGICDGNMEEGSLRCDANVSVRLRGENVLNTRAEIKNMNSVKFLQKAIDFEINRQIMMVENGETVVQETRMFDPETGTTSGMRLKETMNDYRYFPEPDLPPILVSDGMISRIKNEMPPLPYTLFKQFTTEYSLPEHDAITLTENKATALYFLNLCQHTKQYKAAANWVLGTVRSYLNERNIEIQDFILLPERLAMLIDLVTANKVSNSVAAQQLFPLMLLDSQTTPDQLARTNNLIQESNTDTLKTLIREILDANPQKVKEYNNGKKGLIAMFMGELMKRTKGTADPKVATNLVENLLKEQKS